MSVRTDMIWSSLPLPGVLVDKANKIEAINPAAEIFLNTSEKSICGKAVSSCMKLNVDLENSIDRARIQGSPILHRDLKLYRERDERAACDLHIAPVGEGGGQMMILLQPRQFAGHLGRALKVESVAKTAIGLADMLAHEIKNPLAGITGAAQLLSMNLSKEDQEMTDLILQETRRVVDLLKQVEHFGDLRAPNLKPLNVHDILERARITASLGVASSMVFEDKYDPSLPLISADADQLQQVFVNLFANAAEAADEGWGNITIRTYFEPGLRLRSGTGEEGWVPLKIEISDDGPGIPEAALDSIFDPFVSGRENGTGLGLALVSKILTQHEGAIVVGSRPGSTTFRISLPIARINEGTL